MNITEACTWQRVASFLAGDVDHCDETTRAAIAADLAALDARARTPLRAGEARTAEQWDELLCLVTFEAS